MGEVAESMLNGLLCEQCGALIDGEEPGHPRTCSGCKGEKEPMIQRRKKRKRRKRGGGHGP